MKTRKLIESRSWVMFVDDERSIGNSIIVTLRESGGKTWDFKADPGCGVRGFDSWVEAERGTRSSEVVVRGGN